MFAHHSILEENTGSSLVEPLALSATCKAAFSAAPTFYSLSFAFVAAMHKMLVLSYNYCIMTVFFYSIK
jgi:hypothetical protein